MLMIKWDFKISTVSQTDRGENVIQPAGVDIEENKDNHGNDYICYLPSTSSFSKLSKKNWHASLYSLLTNAVQELCTDHISMSVEKWVTNFFPSSRIDLRIRFFG